MSAITPSKLLPIFICPGCGIQRALSHIPGHYLYSLDVLIKELEYLEQLAIDGLVLYEIYPTKGISIPADSILPQVIHSLSSKTRLKLVSDLCVCQYTTHGHCRVIVHNQADDQMTIEALSNFAKQLCDSGVDYIMPSAMLEGLTGKVREVISAGNYQTMIIAQCIKFASTLYQAFRSASSMSVALEKKSYQLDLASAGAAIEAALTNQAEGADLIMVKPALFALDIIAKLQARLHVPVAAFMASGEYNMLLTASNPSECIRESISAIDRAGAQMIVSYAFAEASLFARN